MEGNRHIILFDGQCGLCNNWVRYVNEKDSGDRFTYLPLLSEEAAYLLEKYKLRKDLDTVVLITKGRAYIKSTAALHIFRLLGGKRALLFAFIVIPPFLRHAVYDLVAKHRHRFPSS